MTKEEIIALFPIKAQVTKDILTDTHLMNIKDCTGARTFKSVMPVELHELIRWGVTDGYLVLDGDGQNYSEENIINITTEGHINLMNVDEPTEVTFIILEEGSWTYKIRWY